MSLFAGIIFFAGIPREFSWDALSHLAGNYLEPGKHRRFRHGLFAARTKQVDREALLVEQGSESGLHGFFSLFSGRIDNREELLATLNLTASPHLPDSKLVLLAYQRWRQDTPRHLLGEFAWALWDEAAQQLLLCRDHSAHRSLYYSPFPGGVAFATSCSALLSLPYVARDLNEYAIADVLTTAPSDSDETFYQAIRWVQPAHQILLRADAVDRRPFWQPIPKTELRLKDDREYSDAAREIFMQALNCRLRDSSEVAISLSGGHDSSAIAACLASHHPQRSFYGLTMVPSSSVPLPSDSAWYGSELDHVQTLAKRYGNLKTEFLTAPLTSPLVDEDVFSLGAIPLRGLGNSQWFQPIYRRARELGVKEVLTGDYGNFTLSADGLSRLADLREAGQWYTFGKELLLSKRHLPPRLWHGLILLHAKALLPKIHTWYQYFKKRNGSSPWQLYFGLRSDYLSQGDLLEKIEKNSILLLNPRESKGYQRAVSYAINRSRLQMEALHISQQINGIGSTDPYADRRVIDFCLSLPMQQFMDKGNPRRLSKRAFADVLPQEILAEKKRGAQNSDWFLTLTKQREALHGELEQLTKSDLASRLIDLAYLQKILGELPKRREDAERQVSLYKIHFARALHIGRFLRWHEGCNH